MLPKFLVLQAKMLLLEKVPECAGNPDFEMNLAVVYINLSDTDALIIAATHNTDTHSVHALSHFEKVRLCRSLFHDRGMLKAMDELKTMTRGKSDRSRTLSYETQDVVRVRENFFREPKVQVGECRCDCGEERVL